MSGSTGGIDPEFRARLRRALVTQATDARPVRRGTRLAWGLVAGVCLLAGAGTAWALADRGSEPVAGGLETRSVDVVCAAVAGPVDSLSGSGGALSDPRGIAVSVPVPSGANPSPELIEECARLWDEGLLMSVEFQSGSPQSAPVGRPALALCSLADGAPVVIPAPDCASAGMVDWTEEDRSGS
ncbi:MULTISPECIES: hypothetical protein [unclassified Microbacterium]|uniref:hypothetical protein n=1 Tax=unclassified Microbacterium TaxID=2609290 RepID=UPI000D51AA3E|nr:hypothetical protein [Microbacterium sp. TPD7012]PVE96091.1 hypothetical protein DC434_11360 [Microbacterium sp. TPD7012]